MGRHRAGRRWRPGYAVAVLVAGTGLVAIGLVVLAPGRQAGAAGSAQPCPPPLRVVAAASFAPVLAAVAPAATAPGSGCPALDVVVADGRAAPVRVREVGADLWIPDDRAWAGAPGAPALAAAPVRHVGEPVAVSPLYLVADAPTADAVAASGGWSGLTSLLRTHRASMVIRAPGTSGDGLLAAGALGAAAAPADPAEALAAAQPAVRVVPADEPALPATDGEVGVVAERDLLPEIRSGRTAGLRIVAPADRTAALRYSWFPTAAGAADPAVAARLDRLWHALSGPGSGAALNGAGLRAPGVGLAPGARPGELPPVGSPLFDVLDAPAVRSVFSAFYGPDRRADVLAVVDVSGSMGARPAGAGPLIDQVRAGVQGLTDLLPDDARLGMWEFGAELAPPVDHRVLLGPAELRPDQRAAASSVASALVPQHTGSGLHDTVLAAYTAARDQYRSGVPDVVVVFTDGHDEDDPGSLTREQLAAQLAAAGDPARPVRLSIITFGDSEAAVRLADALTPVGVDVRRAAGPDQVRAAFLHAVAGAAGG